MPGITPPSLTLGLEEEYLLVDPASRDLVAAPPDGFMQRCQDRLAERVTHELLQAQVEVGTSVCQDGIGAELADFGILACKPFGVLLEEIVELVRDEAMRLGCLPEVLRAREILDRGTSADQQLNVYARARRRRRRARGDPGGGRLANRGDARRDRDQHA